MRIIISVAAISTLLAAQPALCQLQPIIQLRSANDSAEMDLLVKAFADSASAIAMNPTVERLRNLEGIQLALQAQKCVAAIGVFNVKVALSQEEAACLFAPGAFQPTNVTFYSRGGSLFTDVYSATFFRSIRVAIGAMVADTNEDEPADDAPEQVGEVRQSVQQLISGGGNVVMSGILPLSFGISSRGNSSFTITGTGRLAVETAALGSNVSNSPVSYAGGFAGNGRIGSDQLDMQMLAGFKLEWIGGNTALRELVGATDDLKYLELSAGFVVGDLFAITAKRIAAGNNFLKRAETQVSITTVTSLRDKL